MGQKAALGGRVHFKGTVKDGALSRCHLICDGIKQALFCLLHPDQRSGDGQGRGNADPENPTRGASLLSGMGVMKAALPASRRVLATLHRRRWRAGV